MQSPPASDRLHCFPAAAGLDDSSPRDPRSLAAAQRVLTPEAVEFWMALERQFRDRRAALLELRKERRQRRAAGELPDFLPATAHVRESEWRIAPVPEELLDRRVEITGPVDAKMIINALNSGAQVFMADFEDANAPTFRNCIEGQDNLAQAVRRKLEFDAPETGKSYRLNERTALLFARPRGWHLDEKHVRLDQRAVSAALFDLGLYAFHNAAELLRRGHTPCFYLPKLESHLEARLWNDVFLWIEARLALPRGSMKATVLIETLPAAFEMDEILYELREHSAGLNCGRWDYIFSAIKELREDPSRVLPDRGKVTMEVHFLRSYSQLLIRTCHRRGAHAMGGMAAQIPIKDDPAQNEQALERVRADKRREAGAGHDGTWVAHPGLVAIARAEFDAVLGGATHQLGKLCSEVQVSASDLLRVPSGSITLAGVRQNLSVGMAYLEAWLSGSGCVPLNNLMEDAATAEISRTQLWHWRTHAACTEDGQRIDAELLRGLVARELETQRERLGEARFLASRWPLAAEIFERLVLSDELEEFLTSAAYARL